MNPAPQPPAVARPKLANVVSEILGDLAFLVTDDAPADLPAGTVWFQAEVRYLGPVVGTLRCWCTRGLGTRLAANLLGIEPETGEAQVSAEDAVREFMNVLCGQLVTRWHGTDSVFTLSIPIVHECIEPPHGDQLQADACCQLSIEGEPLFCTYHREP